MRKILDLVGQKFGKLTVIKLSHFNKYRQLCWVCLCDCGNKKIITGSNLKSKTRSCGCIKKEGNRKTHGFRYTRIYGIWSGILKRCSDKNHKRYKDWGGRGITVCNKWLTFEGFYEDMGSGYRENLSIDRIDNNANYCKSNCRWATIKEQNRNQRSNRLINYNDKTQCVSAWAEELGIKSHTLWTRLFVYKWSIEQALETPIKQ